eukprot:3690678-Prymnesium_polylepis.1
MVERVAPVRRATEACESLRRTHTRATPRKASATDDKGTARQGSGRQSPVAKACADSHGEAHRVMSYTSRAPAAPR